MTGLQLRHFHLYIQFFERKKWIIRYRVFNIINTLKAWPFTNYMYTQPLLYVKQCLLNLLQETFGFGIFHIFSTMLWHTYLKLLASSWKRIRLLCMFRDHGYRWPGDARNHINSRIWICNPRIFWFRQQIIDWGLMMNYQHQLCKHFSMWKLNLSMST